MFGAKNNKNGKQPDYDGYTDYNNEYGGFNEGNYDFYQNNGQYQQDYQNDYQNEYQNNYQGYQGEFDDFRVDYGQDFQNDFNGNYQNNFDNGFNMDSFGDNSYSGFSNQEYPETGLVLYDRSQATKSQFDDFEIYEPDDYKVDINNFYDPNDISQMDQEDYYNNYNGNSGFGGYDSTAEFEPFEETRVSVDRMYYGMPYQVTVTKLANTYDTLNSIKAIISVCIAGVICGSLTSTIFNSFWQRNIASENMMVVVAKILGLILYAFAMSCVHTFLHEMGHLIGGVLTDYRLVSFRLLGYVYVKDGKNSGVKKYDVPGVVGECIMMPPEILNGKYPFLLYFLGGIIMNLITSIAAVALYFKLPFGNEYPWDMFLIGFAAIGIITIFYNGIPLIINGIPNDGYSIMHMIQSLDARISVHTHLLINAYLSKGGRYSDVPYEQFYLSAGGNYSGHLYAKVKLMEYRWHLEHLDFFRAAECLNALDYAFKKLPKIFQYEINSEKLFLEVIGNNNADVISKLYTGQIKSHLGYTISMMSTNRILMAYEACYSGNMKSAEKYYRQLKNGVKSEPLKGEAAFELMLGEFLYEKFCAEYF